MEVLDYCVVASDYVTDFFVLVWFFFPQNIRGRMHRLTPNFSPGESNFIVDFNLCNIFVDLLHGFFWGGREEQGNIQDAERRSRN